MTYQALPTLTYVAMRRLKVGAGYRNKGDLVPEANGWRNAHSYVAAGHLAIIPASTETPHQRVGRPSGTGKTSNHSQPVSPRGVYSDTPRDKR